jgi:hypothetical protein
MALMPHPTVPPSKARTMLVRCLLAGLVPIITSSPGLGKSEISQSVADEYNLKLIDFRLGQADITDLNGLPRFTEDGRAEFAPFNSFPLEGDELPYNPKLARDPNDPSVGRYDGWFLFFDETTSAPKQLQAAAYKIILERMIGHRKLHAKVLMACAGNLATDRAVVHGMSTALQSRLIHIEMRVDHKEWMTWAINKKVDSRILGFLEWKPDYLQKFDPDHQDQTFACPRTWWFANLLVKGTKITNEDAPLLSGTVSAGVAQEFVQFAQIYDDLPKMADILKDPDNAPIPAEPSTKYAMATVIADNFTEKTAEELSTYITRYPMEFRVIMVRMVSQRSPNMVRNRSLQKMFTEVIKHM